MGGFAPYAVLERICSRSLTKNTGIGSGNRSIEIKGGPLRPPLFVDISLLQDIIVQT